MSKQQTYHLTLQVTEQNGLYAATLKNGDKLLADTDGYRWPSEIDAASDVMFKMSSYYSNFEQDLGIYDELAQEWQGTNTEKES